MHMITSLMYEKQNKKKKKKKRQDISDTKLLSAAKSCPTCGKDQTSVT